MSGATPEVAERYRTLGFEAPKLDPQAFADLIAHETQTWGEVIRATHLRLD